MSSSLTFGAGSDLKSEAARADGGVLSNGFSGDGGGPSEWWIGLARGGVPRGFLGLRSEGVTLDELPN